MVSEAETELAAKRDLFMKLRQDAREKGLDGLGIIYGWTAIRLNRELLELICKEINK